MKAFTLIISRMLDVESSRGVEVVKRTEEYRTMFIRERYPYESQCWIPMLCWIGVLLFIQSKSAVGGECFYDYPFRHLVGHRDVSKITHR